MNNIPADIIDDRNELQYAKFSKLLEFLYRLGGGRKRKKIAGFILRLITRFEGGEYRSGTARKLLARDYKVYVGVHSYGEAFIPGTFAPSVKIGKYTSIAKGVRVFTQNHPINTLSTHPYFYEKQFGYIPEDILEPACTVIGNDVWIGQNTIILPGCKTIGDGVVIGAGSVVTKDVPPYAVVGGNPAKIIKFRFQENTIAYLTNLNWWNMDKAEIIAAFNTFQEAP